MSKPNRAPAPKSAPSVPPTQASENAEGVKSAQPYQTPFPPSMMEGAHSIGGKCKDCGK